MRALDLGDVPPIGPEQETRGGEDYWSQGTLLEILGDFGRDRVTLRIFCSPFAWEDCDGSWLVQAVVDQNFAAAAVQTRHLNGVAAGVGPVHIPGHPVHRQAISGLQTLAHHCLHPTAIQVGTPGGGGGGEEGDDEGGGRGERRRRRRKAGEEGEGGGGRG